MLALTFSPGSDKIKTKLTGAMRLPSSPTLRIASGLLLAVLLSIVGYQVLPQWNPHGAETLLKRADKLSWLNDWIAAEPLYREAEAQFLLQHKLSIALYARVSQVPAHSESSTPLPQQIAQLRRDLELPEAQDAGTKLRILTILGMLESNYDAGMARQTWMDVEKLAFRRLEFRLATRAIGEQGFAAFLLGDIATAQKDVEKAWGFAKFTDPAAQIRYASMYGAGLVEFHKYKQALGPLDEAIKVAEKTKGAAYPTIAKTTKIEALSGLGENQQALTLAAEEIRHASGYHLAGHLYELYQTRAGIYERMGQWDQAESDFSQAVQFAKQLSYWRGLTQAGGLLADAYVHQGKLQPALASIDEAITANKNIPDELYFAPRNLGIKAEIMQRLGNTKASNELFDQSADLLDALLSKVPTPNIERQLLSDLSDVYARYFASLCDQDRTADAFRVIERAHGRVEAQALSHHEVITPHDPNPQEQDLVKLNLQLLNASDPNKRERILGEVFNTEQKMTTDSSAIDAPPTPVSLGDFQQRLQDSELFLEYVLSDPQSYVFAVTRNSVHRYILPSKRVLEQESNQYRSELVQKKTDPALGQRLFDGLLGAVPEFKEKRALLVVSDGRVNLLPFAALVDAGKYVVASHLVTAVPSGTVLDMLRSRDDSTPRIDHPYVGVAAWISKPPQSSILARVLRTVSGPDRREFVALPESRHEVEAIANDLPKPSTILLGNQATETDFKALPLGRYNVIHLALHGYVDSEFPDRSALVFAPESSGPDDGLLQVREIRRLPLNATLVTLSACDTGVGPVSAEGVENIVNAFIEAGAHSVVSTLWGVEDNPTAQLMTDFYSHLGRHEPKAEALRQAQLGLVNAGKPPYFWAGFELNGDPTGSLFAESGTEFHSRSAQSE